MRADKTLTTVRATHCASNLEVEGYEIHLGATSGPDCARPFALIEGRPDGACAQDGTVQGSYIHGLFSQDAFRREFLRNLGVEATTTSYEAIVDATLDKLADHLERHLDIDQIMAQAR